MGIRNRAVLGCVRPIAPVFNAPEWFPNYRQHLLHRWKNKKQRSRGRFSVKINALHGETSLADPMFVPPSELANFAAQAVQDQVRNFVLWQQFFERVRSTRSLLDVENLTRIIAAMTLCGYRDADLYKLLVREISDDLKNFTIEQVGVVVSSYSLSLVEYPDSCTHKIISRLNVLVNESLNILSDNNLLFSIFLLSDGLKNSKKFTHLLCEEQYIHTALKFIPNMIEKILTILKKSTKMSEITIGICTLDRLLSLLSTMTTGKNNKIFSNNVISIFNEIYEIITQEPTRKIIASHISQTHIQSNNICLTRQLLLQYLSNNNIKDHNDFCEGFFRLSRIFFSNMHILREEIKLAMISNFIQIFGKIGPTLVISYFEVFTDDTMNEEMEGVVGGYFKCCSALLPRPTWRRGTNLLFDLVTTSDFMNCLDRTTSNLSCLRRMHADTLSHVFLVLNRAGYTGSQDSVVLEIVKKFEDLGFNELKLLQRYLDKNKNKNNEKLDLLKYFLDTNSIHTKFSTTKKCLIC